MLSEVGVFVQEKLLEKSTSLFAEETSDGDLLAERIREHLAWCESQNPPKFSFPSDCEWLNADDSIVGKGGENPFVGKLVVMDFFTYCCVNCLHLLPVLHKLEETYPEEKGVKVVGIHSAKFDNEKVRKNWKILFP
jgi:thiol-disulfide isomerase/thioredoxin